MPAASLVFEKPCPVGGVFSFQGELGIDILATNFVLPESQCDSFAPCMIMLTGRLLAHILQPQQRLSR